MSGAIAQDSKYVTATYAQEYAQRSVVAGADELQESKREEATQKIRTLPGQEETRPDGRKKDSLELSREAQEIRELQVRDQEVRTHEAAHASAGGAYAGSPSYTFEKGPDGQTYAVGGEVSINVSPISGDPAATMQKAQQVRAAALAPAEPSGQDMKVAQRAQSMAAKARSELAQQQVENSETTAAGFAEGSSDETVTNEQGDTENNSPVPASAVSVNRAAGSLVSLNVYA
jgi:hypothetical protein